MSRKCPLILRYCKHGHPRTEETTFPRETRSASGKIYIVRECRVCHAMRNNNARSWARFTRETKWAEIRREVLS